ncbi:MAG: hypothetical protein M3163_15170, partial [Actinomycetota bacterium]|nr:hypothetical protein [Actinomycetota bacterium]
PSSRSTPAPTRSLRRCETSSLVSRDRTKALDRWAFLAAAYGIALVIAGWQATRRPTSPAAPAAVEQGWVRCGERQQR